MLRTMSMIDLDATAIISAGIFIGMLLLLNALLFQPYLRIVRERARLTTGAASSAEDTLAKATAVAAEYSEKMQAAREEASALRADLRGQGEAEELRIVSAAREQATSKLAARRAAIESELAKAESQVESRAAGLADAIVGKVLA